MKIISYILSCYFMILTGVACTDGLPDEIAKDQQTIVQADYTNHSHDHNNEWDGCSPLCSCHCCHVNVFISQALELANPETALLIYNEYSSQFTSIELFDFLRPPKA